MIANPKYRCIAGVTLMIAALLAIWLAPGTTAATHTDRRDSSSRFFPA